MKAFVEMRQLGFSYGRQPVLKDISLTFNEGDFIAIVGPNGAGKSTLLKLMLGLLAPYTGSLKIRGVEVSRRQGSGDIAYVPQAYAQGLKGFPATVEEVVALGCVGPHSLFFRLNRYQKHIVTHMLHLVGMEECAAQLIGELSGGQQQRVMVARALAGSPTALLLDEPTSGVDYEARTKLYDLLSGLNRKLGITVVMVSHDIDKALSYAGKIACIDNGICYYGSAQGFTQTHITAEHGAFFKG